MVADTVVALLVTAAGLVVGVIVTGGSPRKDVPDSSTFLNNVDQSRCVIRLLRLLIHLEIICC